MTTHVKAMIAKMASRRDDQDAELRALDALILARAVAPRRNTGFDNRCSLAIRPIVIRAKTVHLGRVTAPDRQSAIAKAAEDFSIEPARRFRLIAERRSERVPARLICGGSGHDRPPAPDAARR